MSKFLVTYHGGSGMPDDPAQMDRIRAAFGAWLAEAGSAVTDPGAPLRPSFQVSNGNPEPRVAIGGYTVVEGDDEGAVRAVLSKHPFVARGGTLQVDQLV